MSAVHELLDLVRDERDAVLPFFDPYAQLGSAYDELERMLSGDEFQAKCEALRGRSDSSEIDKKLEELSAARARLLHLAMAFAAERKEGKWPVMLKGESREAELRLNAAIDQLEPA